MKKKKSIKRIVKGPKFLYVLMFLIFFVIVGYLMSDESQFKITKEVNGEIIEIEKDWKTTALWIDENVSFSPYYDGIEFLDKNCECQEKECTLSYNYSQKTPVVDKGGGTHNGPILYSEEGSVIFFEPGAQVIEQCGPCQKYQCQDYKIEIIK